MGQPMATNLIKAGYDLAVYDIRPEVVRKCVALGARETRSPADAAADAATIVTMLPTAKELAAVALGPDGAMNSLNRGGVFIDMSTVGPQAYEKIEPVCKAKGVALLDAPVSRGQSAAIAGTLAIMVGGPREVFENQRDILGAMGSDIFYCGQLGMGQVFKLVNNAMVAVIAGAVAEATLMGVKAGADLKVLLNVMKKCSSNSYMLEEVFPQKAFIGDLQPGFTVDLMSKDLGLALATAEDLGVPMFLSSLIRNLYNVMRARGRGGQDFTAILALFEEAAKTEVRFESTKSTVRHAENSPDVKK